MAEYRPEGLARVDGIEELLAHLDWWPLLRSGSSPGSLGVAVRPPAEGAPTAAVPARCRAVRRLTHQRNARGRSPLQREIDQLLRVIIDQPPKVPRERPARHRSGAGSDPRRISGRTFSFHRAT